MSSSTESTAVHNNMHSLLREDRVFAPPAGFAAKAHIQSLEQYEAMYKRSVEDPTGFWSDAANELEWFHALHLRLTRKNQRGPLV